MFNSMSLSKGLSLTKIIGGISRTLQIANQVIPLYQKAKPAIQNAKNVLNVLKEMNKSSNNSNTSKKVIPAIIEESVEPTKKTQASPTFFL